MSAISDPVSGATGEPKVVVAGRKARHTQHAQGVFYKVRRDMSEQFGFEVSLATIGVNDVAGLMHRHRVDGEVAPLKVFFKRD
jgi:hypothetical protein